jgi:predicted Zn-dependent protease
MISCPRFTAGLTAAIFAAATTFAPLPVYAAQELPDLGDYSQSVLSPAQERRLGEQAMREIRQNGAYLNDPEIAAYLNTLGDRLVAAGPDPRQDFDFFAISDSAVNAFALPGGFIGVHTGLLLLAQTESELASVLAHEIAHVTQHHIARMLAGQQRSMWLSIAALAAALLAARAGNGNATQGAIAAAQALQIQSQLDYTREHEREADRIGFQILDRAGFEVQAMSTLFERLQRAGRHADSDAPSYLRSHPVTYERVAEAADRAQGKSYRQVADSADFHYVRALVRSYQGTPQQAVAWFDEALKERKFSSEAATRYGLVAALLRGEQFDRALAELGALETRAPRHAMIEGVAGQLLMQSGRIDQAVRRYETALASFPNHRQLIYDYPDALLKAKRAGDAARFVDSQLQLTPQDGLLHRIAARTYATLGQPLKEHLHQGEFYAWNGNLRGAADQLGLAIKSGGGDFYQRSAVESRLRALQREIAETQKTLQANR